MLSPSKIGMGDAGLVTLAKIKERKREGAIATEEAGDRYTQRRHNLCKEREHYVTMCSHFELMAASSSAETI